jgi:hypothetical protein
MGQVDQVLMVLKLELRLSSRLRLTIRVGRRRRGRCSVLESAVGAVPAGAVVLVVPGQA